MNAAVYEACAARAGGRCECGCGKAIPPGHLDHFFGRAKAEETEATCWFLHPRCDFEKTQNWPDAGAWLIKFMRHAQRHGYTEAYKRAADTFAWKAAKKGEARP